VKHPPTQDIIAAPISAGRTTRAASARLLGLAQGLWRADRRPVQSRPGHHL